MNEVYQKAARPDPEKESTAYTGISSTTHVIHRVVSVKGLVAALAILFLIGALGFMSLSRLKNLASQIVGDTLPRLSLAGQANAYIADTSRTVMFIFAETPEKRAEIRQDIESVSDRTTGYLNKYADNIEAKEERELYENLLAERKTYISIRDHVLDLAQQGRREEAINEYTESLLPAHSRVKAWGDRLYDSDIKRGELRSQRIMVACTLTQITVALIGVVVFVIGFFIGLFR